MSDADTTGFGKFVPGFDFLQNLAKGASTSIPQMPNLGNWVAPTLNVDELEKRIEELKAVHFWLEQNSRALGATIQALEVQKMTLATLKGMNFNMGDVANSLKDKAAQSVQSGVQQVSERATAAAESFSRATSSATEPAPKAAKTSRASKASKSKAAGAAVDPLQLWGALTQQFQQIAATAMREASVKTAMDAGKNMAAGMAKAAAGAATTAAGTTAQGKKAAPAKRATRPAARKSAPRKS